MLPSHKLTVLYVRPKPIKRDHDVSFITHENEDEFGRALSQQCHVVTLDDDFDYVEICEKIRPHFTIIVGPGGNRPLCVTIKNPLARPDIPRIGFFIQDPHDSSRHAFFKLMRTLKIDTFFTLGTSLLRQSPELAHRCYTLPLFFDPTIFHDYQLEKDIPISVFGSLMNPEFYHWRATTVPALISQMSVFLYKHPGYSQPIPAHRFPLQGENYAKMINRSHFSLSDPTRLDYVVRKHLEIPAANAILISAESKELAPYGFVDMENCILGEGLELLKKIFAVCASKPLYHSICTKGYAHVHEKFAVQHWQYFLDWYRCASTLRPGETVQQQGIFGSFVAVTKENTLLPAIQDYTPYESHYMQHMLSARQAILQGVDLATAEELMLSMIRWQVQHLSEPWLLLGIIYLSQGLFSKAQKCIFTAYHIRAEREAIDDVPADPEEIAWLSFLSHFVQNAEISECLTRSAFQNVPHITLRRFNWLMLTLQHPDQTQPIPEDLHVRQADDMLSIHWMSTLSFSEWHGLLTRIIADNSIQDLMECSVLS